MVGTMAIDRHTANIWVARIMPIVLTGVVGYVSYVYIVRMCLHYLLHPPLVPARDALNTYYQKQPQTARAIGFLVGYCIILLLMAVTYFRLVATVLFNPGYTPLGHTALGRSGEGKEAYTPVVAPDAAQHNQEMAPVRPPKAHRSEKSVSSTQDTNGPQDTSLPYVSDSHSNGITNPSMKPRQDLTQVFLRDMYTCDVNGEPRWCGRCGNWKPDRTHHCSEVGRCVEGFDHFCPWVGGVVGLTSFKFFVQFIFYASAYCLYVIITMAISFHEKVTTLGWQSGDANWIALFALGGFFGTFVSGMCLSNTQMMYWGVTTNENFNKTIKRHYIAILDPNQSPSAIDSNSPSNPNTTGTINTSALVDTAAPVSDVPPWQRNEPDRDKAAGFQRRLLVPLSVSALPTTNNNNNNNNTTSTPSSESMNSASSPTSSTSTSTIKKSSVQHTGHYYKIYLTTPGLNPWHLGLFQTAVDILGPRPWDWFLPTHRPCRTPHNSEDDVVVNHSGTFGRWSDEKLQQTLDAEKWARTNKGAARSRVYGIRSWYPFGDRLMEFIYKEDEKRQAKTTSRRGDSAAAADDYESDEERRRSKKKRRRRESRNLTSE